MTSSKHNTTLSNPALLQKIDRLREQNIGQHVPLPQLVVVGDQSSGKSSLLESLTGIPFPRNVELCTRHATQITSRRDDKSRIEIRIIPGPQASEDHQRHLETYTESLPSSKDLRHRFAEIMKAANDKMGIRSDVSSISGAMFSEDVLKIEICGPKEDYLTVIDVPGIFRNPTEGQTTKDDILLVNNLVRRYIKDERTIILAVLPCNVDIATQEIIALAEEYDRHGTRTLGVLTKPDLVFESSAKRSVCSLVAGSRKPLTLGYYLVRNRGADDEGKIEHSELETLFLQEPWCTLAPERVGISALKKQLEILLAQITRDEFPSLRREIQFQLEHTQKELIAIGPARPKEREQRGFLSNIARRFEELVREALDAQYSYSDLFQNDSTRLITQLVNLTDLFNQTFHEYGQVYLFKEIGPTEMESGIDESSGIRTPSEPHHGLAQPLLDRDGTNEADFPELDDIVAYNVKIKQPRSGIMSWITKLNYASRGMEMGTFNPNLLSAAFWEQSQQWKGMVQIYMSQVVRLIHFFMTAALTHICPDKEVTGKIWSHVMGSILQKYRSGLQQALLLVEVERSYPPYTLNGSFNQEVQDARGNRMKELLKPKAWCSQKQFDVTRLVVNLDEVPKATTAKSNEQHVEEEIHDKLRAYYRVAGDRTVDNIFRQAVYFTLLKGPESPLTVFSQSLVVDLDPETLGVIAGETEATKTRRSILTKKKRDLENALDILRV